MNLLQHFTPDEQEALAKKWFPGQWELTQWKSRPGKKRRALRIAAVQAEVELQLKQAGRYCSNCSHHSRRAAPDLKKSHYCILQSDFHGFVSTVPTNTCVQHEWKRHDPHPTSHAA